MIISIMSSDLREFLVVIDLEALYQRVLDAALVLLAGDGGTVAGGGLLMTEYLRCAADRFIDG